MGEANAFFGILEKSYEGKLTIVGSVAVDVEVGRAENLEKRAVTQRLIAFFVSERVCNIPGSRIREIREATGLKLPDAAHLACTLEAGCKYFITCDDEIIKKGKEIKRRYGLKIYNPVDFINLEEEKW